MRYWIFRKSRSESGFSSADDMEKNLVETILSMTGIHITPDKYYLLESRLNEVMRECNFHSYDEIAALLKQSHDSELAHSVIDKITTHETLFFREESIFDALVLQILPEWLERNPETATIPQNITVWSAGCSTGQEPYSIAMAICEKFPKLSPRVKITATDISRHTLEKAEKGIYTKFEIDRGMPPHLLKKYFHEKIHAGNAPPGNPLFEISNDIKGMVQFKRHNLTSLEAPGLFDIIFCRNVCIYFQEELRKKIYESLIASLKVDGALVLGAAETLYGIIPNVIVRECGMARYFEGNSSNVTFF